MEVSGNRNGQVKYIAQFGLVANAALSAENISAN